MRIELTPRAERDLRKLKKDQVLLNRLYTGMQELVLDPDKGKDLEGNYAGVLSLRIGDWRILYEVFPEEELISIYRIGHRREVYR